jgi:uncharacterized membrane protein
VVRLYTVLLFVHITAIALWVGGGFMLALLGVRAAKAGPPAPQLVIRNLEVAEWLGPHFYLPVILTTLVSGIWLVVESGFGFGHFFVLVGLGMVILAAGMGVGFFVPRAKALITHINERGVDAEAVARMAQVALVSKVMLGLLILTIFTMTTKPFS